MFTRVFAAVSVAAFVVCVLACGGAGEDGAGKKAAPEPAAVFVIASELADAYEANEVAADEKYKGKRIGVVGQVDTIGKDILDDPYVVLSVNGKGRVQCMFAKGDAKALAELKKGDRITIEGECRGKSIGSVMLGKCSIRPEKKDDK